MAADIERHPDYAALNAYHDGELRGYARADVEAHLATCRRCRRDARELDGLDRALRGLPQVEPTPIVQERIRQGIRAGMHRSRRGGVPWLLVAAVGAVAALLQAASIIVPRPAAVPVAIALPSHPPLHGATFAARGQKRAVSLARAIPTAEVTRATIRHALMSSGCIGNTARQMACAAALDHTSGAVPARLIARSGQVDMQVADVAQAVRAVRVLAGQEGGYISSVDRRASGSGRGYTLTLTLRLPASQFQDTVGRLAALPHARFARRLSSDDVTDAYRALTAELQTLQAGRSKALDQTRAMLRGADAASALDRLSSIDAQIERVQRQILSRGQSVMLATITTRLHPAP